MEIVVEDEIAKMGEALRADIRQAIGAIYAEAVEKAARAELERALE